MKKIIFAIIAVATLSIASCKKEEIAAPSATFKANTVADTKESGAGWDDQVTPPTGDDTSISDTKESGAGWDNP